MLVKDISDPSLKKACLFNLFSKGSREKRSDVETKSKK